MVPVNLNFLAGLVIDQKYELLSVAGSGGMGTVYKAKQAHIDRIVAIKLLQTGNLPESKETMLRFEREARMMSNLQHENIGAFYSYGIWNESIPYMAMEYLDGKSLMEVINAEERLDWRRVVKIGIQICDALSYAHENNFIHRDIKPSNIILMDNPTPDFVKVIDFGLAKVVAEDGKELQKLTQTGTLLGSVQYMSPELCQGHPATVLCDIYSSGCLLYQCISGRLPHIADNPIGLMHKHVNENVVGISKLLPDAVPAQLDQVLLKALAREPGKRYSSMLNFRNDLEAVLKGTDLHILAERDTQLSEQVGKGRYLRLGLLTGMPIVLAATGLLLWGGPRLLGLQSVNTTSIETGSAINAYSEQQLASQYKSYIFQCHEAIVPEKQIQIMEHCLRLPVPKRNLDLRFLALQAAQVAAEKTNRLDAARKYSKESLALTASPEFKTASMDIQRRNTYRDAALQSAIGLDLATNNSDEVPALLADLSRVRSEHSIKISDQIQMLIYQDSLSKLKQRDQDSSEITKRIAKLERDYIERIKRYQDSPHDQDLQGASYLCGMLSNSGRWSESKNLMLNVMSILREQDRLPAQFELMGIRSIAADVISFCNYKSNHQGTKNSFAPTFSKSEFESLSKQYIRCLHQVYDSKAPKLPIESNRRVLLDTRTTFAPKEEAEMAEADMRDARMKEDACIDGCIDLCTILVKCKDANTASALMNETSKIFHESKKWSAPETKADFDDLRNAIDRIGKDMANRKS